MLRKSPFTGVLFEGFVTSEIVKQQANNGQRREVYYFRDQQGLEVDLVVPNGAGKLTLIEIKSSRTPLPGMAKPLAKLSRNIQRYKCQSILVHNGKDELPGQALLPGISAMSPKQLLRALL